MIAVERMNITKRSVRGVIKHSASTYRTGLHIANTRFRVLMVAATTIGRLSARRLNILWGDLDAAIVETR